MKRDVFVHDMENSTTTRVSLRSDGAEANGDSIRPFISSNGRFVSFVSTSTNLDLNDSSPGKDIYVHDRSTGKTILVSRNLNGSVGNDQSVKPSISADGRFVVFESNASNLVPADTNGYSDVFLVELSVEGPPSWGGYPVANEAGDVDTETFMSWINVFQSPWVWCYATSCWFYIQEIVAETGSGWIYIPGLTFNTPELWLVMIPDTAWGYSYGLGKWFYVDPTGSGWVYLL